jgi:hypothetical protein
MKWKCHDENVLCASDKIVPMKLRARLYNDACD